TEAEEAAAEVGGATPDMQNDLLEEERWGSGEVLLTRVALVDDTDHELVAIGGGTPVTIEMEVEVRAPQEDFVFGIGIFHADGTCVYGTNTDIEGWMPQRLEGDVLVRFVMPSLDLVAGSYRIDAAVHTRSGRAFDYRRGVLRFVVGSRVHDTGVYRPRHRWEFHGGAHFRSVDTLERNVPAPIAEYIRESGDEPSQYRKRKKREE
ncbi:MAG: Wzt carbohydrate-binding domain-containing protein, partial [Thermoanaerobaculia bacterium]